MSNKRIEISLSPNTTVIPFDYQYELVQGFNRMMGFVESPDNPDNPDNSLYTIGWLQPQQGMQYSVVQYEGLNFQDGARFHITCHSEYMAKDVLECIVKFGDNEFLCGMQIEDCDTIPTPEFTSKTRFFMDSPALVRQVIGGRVHHLTYKNRESAVYLSNVLRTKMNMVGLDGDVMVSFDEDYPKAKEKLININGELCKCSQCPVWVVASSPEIVKFAWEVGVGHGTGAGFGAIAPYQPHANSPSLVTRQANDLVYR